MHCLLAATVWLVLIFAGMVGTGHPPHAPSSSQSQINKWRAHAYNLYLSGHYKEAEAAYRRGYQLAVRSGNRVAAFRLLNGAGGACFAMFQYREAMRAFLDSRELARKIGNSELLAVVANNLSSLYLHQLELNAGAQAAAEAMDALRRAPGFRQAPLLRAQSAILFARRDNLSTALPLFYLGLREAQERLDPVTEAFIWDQLGYELLLHNRLADAEGPLLAAYRIRSLRKHPDLKYSYYTLGLFRLARGDAAGAERLFDLSLEQNARTAGILTRWRVYFERGRARMLGGKVAGALQDFQDALELARLARHELVPADSIRLSAGVDQSRLYSSVIQAAGALSVQTGDTSCSLLGFEAAEEARAASLRALIHSPAKWREMLPPEYWESVARLRTVEAELLNGEGPSLSEDLNRVRYRLTEMEAAVGLKLFPFGEDAGRAAPRLLDQVRRALHGDEAYFSFHLDEPRSLLWVVTRQRFGMFLLPGRSQLETDAGAFQTAVRLDQPDHHLRGERLFRDLFGNVPQRFLDAPRWSLSLEGGLFHVPFAALVSGWRQGRPEYLAQRHFLRVIPSALFLQDEAKRRWDGGFVGIADPVYNAADPRGAGARDSAGPTEFSFLRLLPEAQAAPYNFSRLELPRLAGSGQEIQSCLKAWGGEPGAATVFTGPDATLARVEGALAKGASVVHFATHFLLSAGHPRQAMVALSLGSNGAPELLGPDQISRTRLDLRLVVLNGCNSAGAAVLPSEGLMGMTRAWLAAGAGSVLATLWPTPDGQGKLLACFYSHLARIRGRGDGWVAAEALRYAQLEMLRSSGVDQSPAHWGAYLLAGKE